VSHFLPCSALAKKSCDKALDALPKFESSKKMFHQIFKFKQEYSHCLDGGIAEGISAVIVESLNKNWNQLTEVVTLNKKDPSFQKFILSNIQPHVTAQEAEVNLIIGQAKKTCPKKMRNFCKDLIRSCENSLKSEL
jgi:hypothetical protein